MHATENQLEDFLLDSSLVSKDEMKKALKNAKEKKQKISDALVGSGVLSKDDVRRAHAHILGIPFVNIENTNIDLATLALIPEPISRNHNIVAFNKKGDSIEIAMLDLADLKSIDFLKKAGMKLLPRLTTDESIKKALFSYQKFLKDGFGETIAKGSTSSLKATEALLKHAFLQNASDIHIDPLEDRVLVRYRIGGLLRDAMVLPKNTFAEILSRIKTLAGIKEEKGIVSYDGRFALEADGERLNFRVLTAPVQHGEKLVVKIVQEHANGFTLEGLGLEGDTLEDLYKALNLREGLILVSGLTGSGRTTTLYTLLDILNRPELNIATIEDPVEYQMHRINQTQVRPEIGFSFADGLRAILRHEPDVVMVGEIKDPETAHLALNAAYAGRLVLASITATSPKDAIILLKTMDVAPTLLASGLKIALAQKLVKNSAGSYRGEYELLKMSPTLREFILHGVI